MNKARRFAQLRQQSIPFVLLAFRQAIQHRVEANKAEQQHRAIKPINAAIQREGSGHDREEDHDRNLAPQQNRFDAQRRDQAGRAQNQANVGDVGADHVANRQIALAHQRRLKADEQFWHGGADGDECERDHEYGHAKGHGQIRGAPHQPVAAEEKGD